MTESLNYQRTLALAAIFQASNLVHCIAAQGKLDKNFFNITIGSLLKTSSNDLTDIYGTERNIMFGVDHLAAFVKLEPKLPDSPLITKYSLQLLRLADMLHRDRRMADKIAFAIRGLQSRARSSKTIPFALVENMADIYYDNFSQLGSFQRIRIMGKKEYLGEVRNVSRIRALLLAGVRAAILWRSLGGNQWTLLFSKKALANQLVSIRKRIDDGKS